MNLAPSNSTLLRVLAGQTCSPPPIWLMRQAGRYLPEYRALRAKAGSFLDLCYTPALASEATLQPVRRFGFDAAILFSDILVVPDALGCEVRFREGEGPILDPVTDGRTIASLRPNRLLEHLQPVLETVTRVRGQLSADVPLIGFCGAPWTVACYMVAGRGTPDQAPARAMAYRDPESFARLIDILIEASAAYLIAQARAGVQVVQIFDSWAGALAPDQFWRWCIEPTRAILDRVRQTHPDLPVIGFPRAAGPHYGAYLDATGITAIACDTSLPLDWTARTLQCKAPVQGNLDPLLLATGGPGLDARVAAILDALGHGPLVFNLGHGVLPETPLDHVARLVALVRKEG